MINPIVYAEVSVGYENVEMLDSLLPAEISSANRCPSGPDSWPVRAYLRYRKNDGTKRSPMPDFYIGAHAAIAGYRLLTRDE
ncbi:MAG: type II toxin-antitoxin system VapC family toxin, partial [Stackebrandtia sp.]